MPKLVCLLAVLMLVGGAANAHSWYPEECCHDKDCHPVPCEEIDKISDGWLWRDKATKQRHWFPHGRLHASHDDACHVRFANDDTWRHLSLCAAASISPQP
jgi:hypothetical protein